MTRTRPEPLHRPAQAAGSIGTRLKGWLDASVLWLIDGPIRQTRAIGGERPQAYLHHRAVLRRIFNPLNVRFGNDAVLFVRGRKSGKRLAVPMDPPFEWNGERYLVSPLGNTHWARNLRAAGEGAMRVGGRVERFRAIELRGAERDAMVRTYGDTITCGCQHYLELLPDPDDHPVFRMEPMPGSGDCG